MKGKMYLLDIYDLEDKNLAEQALALIDGHRRLIVDKYSKEKDRLRAIAAGLLLQVGFEELTFSEEWCEQISLLQKGIDGICYKMHAKPLVRYLQEQPCMKQPVYGKGDHGKPFWERKSLEKHERESGECHKVFWEFNLSHSGAYVGLVIADCKVGLDIQEPRNVERFEGGFQEFSRMEAYVKCTGEGYVRGIEFYRKQRGTVEGYTIKKLDIIEDYAMHICFARN